MERAKCLDFASIRIDDAFRTRDVIGRRGSVRGAESRARCRQEEAATRGSDSRYSRREARRAQDRRLGEGCVRTWIVQSQPASIRSNRDNDVLLEAV